VPRAYGLKIASAALPATFANASPRVHPADIAVQDGAIGSWQLPFFFLKHYQKMLHFGFRPFSNVMFQHGHGIFL
jgi:hypothetical protein